MPERRGFGPILLVAVGVATCLIGAGLRQEPVILGGTLLVVAGLAWHGRFPADRGW